MKSWLLSLLCSVALAADSISITFPGAGTPAISGGYGFNSVVTFTVSSGGTDIQKVCYTIDGAYPLYHPGIDAATTLGCSLKPPYSIRFNSFWYPNGPHTVVANAYNALGVVVATSAAVPFTTANTWPVPANPTLSVSANASPWSGSQTITATVGNTGTDSLTANYYIDGIAQAATTATNGTLAATLYTGQFQNGTHNVCLNVVDNALQSTPKAPNGNTITFDGASNWSAEAGEWCQQATFANTSAVLPAQALVNVHEVHLTVGGPSGGDFDTAPSTAGSCKLTARVLNTDGTTTASTPVCSVTDPTTGVYVTGAVAGSLTAPQNLQAGVATVDSSTCIVTAVSNGAALVNVMTPVGSAITDLVPASNPIFLKSLSQYTFTAPDIGKLLDITGGGSCTPGIYQISNALGNQALMGVGGFAPAAAFGGSGNCTATIGPTRQVWVDVWPTNTYPSYGSDGSIQTSFNAAKSLFWVDLYNPAFQMLQEDQPYNSIVSPGSCPGKTSYGLPCGISVDLGVSGFDTFEVGFPTSSINISGTSSPSTWTTNLPSYVNTTIQTNGLALNPKFKAIVLAGALLNQPQGTPNPLWVFTSGAESSPTFIGGNQTALQYTASTYAAAGNILGFTGIDEQTGTYPNPPLQGPLTFSANGTAQSALTSIVANGGNCAASVQSPANGQPIQTINDTAFMISGSSVSGMNSVSPGFYTKSVASGAIGKASVVSGAVTVAMTGSGTSQGSNYFFPPKVSLVGGGGTYTSATATVDGSGHVNSITVIGSANYIAPPQVAISTSDFYGVNAGFSWSCPGVANGTYNASNDPGLKIEPIADGWYTNGLAGGSNPDFTHWDAFAKFRQQILALPTHLFWQAPPNGGSPARVFANFTGSAFFPGAQSIGGVNSVADSGDIYFPVAAFTYLNSRPGANTLLSQGNPGHWARSLYGAISPDRPWSGLVGTTDAYAGYQGYKVNLVSCVGNTLTFSAPHGLNNIIPGITRIQAVAGATDQTGAVDSCNGPFTVLTAPTSSTLTVLMGATDFSSNGTGGTAIFSGGRTQALTTITAAGTPTQNFSNRIATLNINAELGGDLITIPAWNGANNRVRGQTFTVSGVSGSTTPTSGCLTGTCTWTNSTFLLLPENLNLPSAPLDGLSAVRLFYREVPQLNATGGTATILPDFKIHLGMSPQQPLNHETAPIEIGQFFEELFSGSSAARLYKFTGQPDGYSDQLGFTCNNFPGMCQLQGFASGAFITNAQVQPYPNLHEESGPNVPVGWAVSDAVLEVKRDSKYWLSPRANSPDCTFMIDCGARTGAAGSIFYAMNLTDGPYAFTTPSLTPYETSGQQIIRKIVNAQGIGPITVLAAGTAADTITLQPLDVVIYTFPKNFSSELQTPTFAVRMADVANASDLVVHWAYDPYFLQVAPNVFDCGGTGLCTLPADLNFRATPTGTAIFYQYVFRDSSGNILTCKNGNCAVNSL